jgi:hypothetical protein
MKHSLSGDLVRLMVVADLGGCAAAGVPEAWCEGIWAMGVMGRAGPQAPGSPAG